jgi:hypothetical protein
MYVSQSVPTSGALIGFVRIKKIPPGLFNSSVFQAGGITQF